MQKCMFTWGVNLKVTGSKLEGDSGSGSKLEGGLILGTRCHSMDTACENMRLVHVFPQDCTPFGEKLEGDFDSKLEGDLLLGTRCHSPVALAVNCCCSPCVIITLNNNSMKF